LIQRLLKNLKRKQGKSVKVISLVTSLKGPIGPQPFKEMIDSGYYYVDKTPIYLWFMNAN
jgi:hypothetical protein